ncbi:hypothetical protein D3C72_1588700 [compost metagenome]
MKHSRGISLLEVSLAVSVGLMLTAGGVYAYRQHLKSTQVTQAKLMLSTMRQEIEMYRYRTGRPPTHAVFITNVYELVPGNPATRKAFYGKPAAPLRDPLNPPMDAAVSSPIKNLAAAQATGSPWGGWAYHQTTGYLEPNLDPAAFPGDPPSAW